MNEKELYQAIKKQSQEIDVPNSLLPENMANKLEKAEMEKRPRPRNRYLRMGVLAASLVLVVSLTTVLWNQFGFTVDDDLSGHAVSDYNEVYRIMKKIQSDAKNSGGIAGLFGATAGGDMGGMAMEDAAPAAGAGEDYSETNTQVEGVDEGDVVKTDGSYLYAAQNGYGSLKVHISSVEKGKLQKKASISIPKEEGETNIDEIRELYISGTSLVVIASGYQTSQSEQWWRDTTYIYCYDLSDIEKPVRKAKMTQDGYYYSSRVTGGYLYTFSSHAVYDAKKAQPETFVPLVNDALIACENMIFPSVRPSSDYAIITSYKLGEEKTFTDEKALVGSVNNLYVSNDAIYLAVCGEKDTEIIKLSYKEGNLTETASGTVKGYFNDQFSMDEADGKLRIVTTVWGDEKNNWMQTNSLYILDEKLEMLGSIENLAKDEEIYSARFIGDTAYFVTFRQTDPLFSVDLSDPQNPKIMGELKIPGFSSYLHPYGDGQLLGIGMDGNESGTNGYAKLSMYDVSDPYAVEEVHKYVLSGDGWIEALYNHKAIFVDVEKNLFGFQAESEHDVEDGAYTVKLNYCLFSYDRQKGFYKVADLSLNRSSSDYLTDSYRGMYIGDYFIVAGGGHLISFDMKDDYKQVDELVIQ